MKLFEIAECLEATILTQNDNMEMECTRAGASDLLSDILAGLSDGGVLVTGLITLQVVKTAIISGVTTVVYVRNKRPPQDVIELAEAEGIPLLSSPYSMFVSSGRLYAAGMTGLDGKR